MPPIVAIERRFDLRNPVGKIITRPVHNYHPITFLKDEKITSYKMREPLFGKRISHERTSYSLSITITYARQPNAIGTINVVLGHQIPKLINGAHSDTGASLESFFAHKEWEFDYNTLWLSISIADDLKSRNKFRAQTAINGRKSFLPFIGRHTYLFNLYKYLVRVIIQATSPLSSLES